MQTWVAAAAAKQRGGGEKERERKRREKERERKREREKERKRERERGEKLRDIDILAAHDVAVLVVPAERRDVINHRQISEPFGEVAPGGEERGVPVHLLPAPPKAVHRADEVLVELPRLKLDPVLCVRLIELDEDLLGLAPDSEVAVYAPIRVYEGENRKRREKRGEKTAVRVRASEPNGAPGWTVRRGGRCAGD